jgi:hypothetical protein
MICSKCHFIILTSGPQNFPNALQTHRSSALPDLMDLSRCVFQLRVLVMIRPRYLKKVEVVRGVPLRWRGGCLDLGSIGSILLRSF